MGRSANVLTLDIRKLKLACAQNKRDWPTTELFKDYHERTNVAGEMTRKFWSKFQPMTYTDIIALYLLFHDGCVPGTPSYGNTSLTSDIKSSTAADLRNINTLQFLTIDSQPGIITKGHEYQREYIIGFFPTKKIQHLYNSLASQGNIAIGLFTETKDGPWLRIHTDLSNVPVSASPRIKDSREIPVTIVGSEDPNDGFEVFSSLPIEPSADGSWLLAAHRFLIDLQNCLYFTRDENLKSWCMNHLCLVCILAKEWGTDGALTKQLSRSLEALSTRKSTSLDKINFSVQHGDRN
jgi:hypothetical protein